MKPRLALLLVLLPASLAAADSRPAPKPAATPVGPPTSCIPLSQVQSTRIRDDWTIDFISSGNRAWRNALTHRCSGLRSDNAITYATSLSQLCNTDIVYTLRNVGGSLQRGGPCSLGQFVPVKLER
jgi:hypothetical protein